MARHHVYRNFPFSVVLYDRSCPLCRSEIERLAHRDHAGRLQLVDISAADFDPDLWNFSLESLNRALHVRCPDGQWLIGVSAVAHVYRQVGLGWLWWSSRLPLLSRLMQILYLRIARHRYVLSNWYARFFHSRQAHTPCSRTLCNPLADNSIDTTKTNSGKQEAHHV